MFRKTLLVAILMSAVSASMLRAQNDEKKPSITGEPEEATLINERIEFVKSFYPVSADQVEKLRKELNARVDVHKEYMNRNDLMLRRRTTAISAVLPQDQTHSVEQITALRAKYQEEIYRIREAAPLSLTASVRMAEDMLTPEGRNSGRGKVEAFFAKQLNGQHVDPSRLDRLILSPVPMLDVSQHDELTDTQNKLMGNTPKKIKASNRPTSEEIRAAKEAAIKAKREAKTLNAADPHAGHDHGPVPPPPSNRSIETISLNAPALDQWESQFQAWATDYEFTPVQKGAAELIYKHCLDQAKRQPVTDDTSAKRLDVIFTQMKQRIDSVASIEQRERLKSKQKAAGKSDDKSKS